MIRRTTSRILEVLAAFAALVLIVVGLLAWMIASGPVALDFFKPSIASALEDAFDADGVDFKSAALEWTDKGKAIRLRVHDMRVYGPQGTLAIRIPEMEMGFSVAGLTHGLIAPTRVIFSGASARLVRSPDGAMAVGFVPNGQGRLVESLPPSPEDEPEGEVVVDVPLSPEEIAGLDAAKETLKDKPLAPDAHPGAPELDIIATGTRNLDVAARLVGQLAGPRDAQSALGYLEEVTIQRARLTLVDRRTDSELDARNASLTLRRGQPGITADLDAIVSAGGKDVMVSLTSNHDPKAGMSRVALSFTDIAIDALAQHFPVLGSTGYEGPVSGDLKLTIHDDGTVGLVDADVLAGPGRVVLPKPDTLPMVEDRVMEEMLATVPEAVEIKSAGFSGSFDLKTGAVALRGISLQTDKAKMVLMGEGALEIDFAGGALKAFDFDLGAENFDLNVPVYSERTAKIDRLVVKGGIGEDGLYALEDLTIEAYGGSIKLQGRFGDVDGKPEIFMTGSIDQLPVKDFMSFWPQGTALGARDWITENITQGVIASGDLKFDAPAGTFDVGYMPDEAMRLELKLAGVNTSFVKGLPQMTDIQGTALLLGDTFEMTVDSGRIGAVMVSEGKMLTAPLHKRGAVGKFEAVLSGPLSEMLGLLDSGPFGYPSKYGIDTTRVGGQGSLRLNVSFPMLRALKMEQIEFAGAANIADLNMPSLVGERALSEGNLFMSVNGAGLKAEGTLKVAGVPTTMLWTEDFTGTSENPSYFKMSALFDKEVYRTFGIDTYGIIEGPVHVDIVAMGRGADLSQITIDADLTKAAMTFPGGHWSKPAGDEASAHFGGSVAADGHFQADSVTLKGPGLALDGQFLLGPDLSLLSADFPTVKIAELMDVRLTADRSDEELSVVLAGDYLDAAPFLDSLMAGTQGGAPAEGASRPFRLRANLQRFGLLNGITLADPSLKLFSKSGTIEDLTLSGTFEGSGTVNVDLKRKSPSERKLIVNATDAGKLAYGLFDSDTVRGGRLRVDAVFTDTGDKAVPIRAEGDLTLNDFRIANVPLLARLLTIGSFEGLGDLVQGEGIWFEKLDVPFESDGIAWQLKEGRAHGPSIGITVEGGLDTDMQATDLQGTIVPAYTINSLLGKVPLIGGLLVGKKGEGVIGITYRVVGSEEGSNLYVNPLSALAPGFLRRLFQIRPDDEKGKE